MDDTERFHIKRDIASLYGFGAIIAHDPPFAKPLTPLELMQYEAEMVGAAYALAFSEGSAHVDASN